MIDRGAEIYFYTCKRHKELINKLGAVSLDYRYRNCDTENNTSAYNYPNFNYTKYLVATTYQAMELYKELAQMIEADIGRLKPDLIIHDCFSLYGKILAKQYSTPAINIVPSYALNSNIPNQFLRLLLESTRYEKYNDSEYQNAKKTFFDTERMIKRKHPYIESLLDAVTSEEDVNIALSCAEFNMFRDSFNPAYKFVGRFHKSRMSYTSKVKKEKYIIYISMGTLFNHERDFYIKCIQAFNNTKHQVIVKAPRNELLNFKEICSGNFSFYEYVSQIDILKKAELFISHCGNNSFYEAIENEVPIMCCPMGIDQFFVSKTAVELGIGEIINPQEINSRELYDKAIDIIHSNTISKNLSFANEILRSYEMLDMVVDTIITY